MKNVNDVIDKYCIEKYGHRDWSYLRTGDRKLDFSIRQCLKENNHTIEGGVVFWHALDKFIQDLKDGRYIPIKTLMKGK